MSDQLTATILILLIAGAAYWLSLRLGHRFVERLSQKDEERGARAATIWTVIKRVVVVVMVVIAALLVLSVWEISITPFLAVGTVMAAAIGFGAQDLVKDVVTGFFILVEDQFHVGDTVTIAGTSGVVQDIQLRVTKLRDVEGNVHFVPNGQITVTSNFTSKFAQPVLDIGIAYEADVDRALAVLMEVLTELSGDETFGQLIVAEPEVLGVHSLADSAVIIRGRLTTVADSRWEVRREALRRIKKRFDTEGISIPFPQITINRKA